MALSSSADTCERKLLVKLEFGSRLQLHSFEEVVLGDVVSNGFEQLKNKEEKEKG